MSDGARSSRRVGKADGSCRPGRFGHGRATYIEDSELSKALVSVVAEAFVLSGRDPGTLHARSEGDFGHAWQCQLQKKSMEMKFVPVGIAVRGSTDARLVFSGDSIVAVLALLGDLYENNSGKWFLEVAFHEKIANIGRIFDNLTEAEEWIAASLNFERNYDDSASTVSSDQAVAGKGAIDVRTLTSIAETLGLSMHDMLSGDGSPGDVSKASDCLRLWSALRTDGGRRRALECLSRIVDEEQS